MLFDATPLSATERVQYLKRTRATVAVLWLLPLGGLALKLMMGLASFAFPGADFSDVEIELGHFFSLMAFVALAGLQMSMRRVIASLPDPSTPDQTADSQVHR